jgi:hypothetical protein
MTGHLLALLISLRIAWEKRLQDKGVSFQQLLQAKQHRYYMREEKTREVVKKRFITVLNDDQEAIEEGNADENETSEAGPTSVV